MEIWRSFLAENFPTEKTTLNSSVSIPSIFCEEKVSSERTKGSIHSVIVLFHNEVSRYVVDIIRVIINTPPVVIIIMNELSIE